MRWFIVMSLCVAAGCASAEFHWGPQPLPLPEELAATEAMRVEGVEGWMPGRRIRFGPYRAEVAREPAHVDESRDGDGAATAATAAAFGFGLFEAETRLAWVECSQRSREHTDPGLLAGSDLEWLSRRTTSRSLLRCEIDLGGGAEAWWLRIERGTDDVLHGVLATGSLAYRLIPISDFDGGDDVVIRPRGFVIRDEHAALAAVALHGGGVAHIRDDVPPEPRAALAAALVVLLAAAGPPIELLGSTR